jgi:hypothetical protein
MNEGRYKAIALNPARAIAYVQVGQFRFTIKPNKNCNLQVAGAGSTDA